MLAEALHAYTILLWNTTNTLQQQKPVVDVTTPADDLFEAKLRSLRPGHSVDPRRWSLRGEQFMQATNFTAALFCFGKAQDTRGTMKAQAKLHAENSRTCKALGDMQGSIMACDAAVELYKQLNLVLEAAALLEYMDRLEDAAGKLERPRNLTETLC